MTLLWKSIVVFLQNQSDQVLWLGYV